MKQALILIAVVAAIAFALFKFTAPSSTGTRIPMPWQITVIDDQHVEVFDLVLNRSTLAQAVEQFGLLEDVAVYRDLQDQFSLEAYLGKVSMGPLSARLILNLKASPQELSEMAASTRKRSATENGSEKWTLSENQRQQQMRRVIRALTYIPDYAGMEESFLIEQFGEPQRREKVDENSELLFYPQSGLRILVDKEGREVFEYMSPADFVAISGESS